MNDVGRAFSFIFHQRNWGSKLVLGAMVMLLCLVGVGIPVIVGYLIRVTQRVMNGDEDLLPDWNDLGVMFVAGFKFCIVYLVFLLPVLAMLVPMLGLAVIASATDSTAAFDLLLAVYAFGVVLIIIPYSIFLQAVSPIIAYRYARRERMSDALNIRAIFRDFRANWQNTVMVALLVVGIESFAAVGLLFIVIGVLFTLLYTYLVSAYLHGMVYRSLPDGLKEDLE
jgi:hypothetical protein